MTHSININSWKPSFPPHAIFYRKRNICFDNTVVYAIFLPFCRQCPRIIFSRHYKYLLNKWYVKWILLHWLTFCLDLIVLQSTGGNTIKSSRVLSQHIVIKIAMVCKHTCNVYIHLWILQSTHERGNCIEQMTRSMTNVHSIAFIWINMNYMVRGHVPM